MKMEAILFETKTSTYQLTHDDGMFVLRKIKLHDGQQSWAPEGYEEGTNRKPEITCTGQLVMPDMHTSPIRNAAPVEAWLDAIGQK